MNDHQSPHSGLTPAACLPRSLQKPRLRRSEASEYLLTMHGLSFAPATLAKMACVGGGPGYSKVNRTPMYPVVELDRWAAEKLGVVAYSTTEHAAVR